MVEAFKELANYWNKSVDEGTKGIRLEFYEDSTAELARRQHYNAKAGLAGAAGIGIGSVGLTLIRNGERLLKKDSGEERSKGVLRFGVRGGKILSSLLVAAGGFFVAGSLLEGSVIESIIRGRGNKIS